VKPNLTKDRLGRTILDAAWTSCDLDAWHGVLFGGLQAIGYDVAFLKTVIPDLLT
jgi:hypothetical protein